MNLEGRGCSEPRLHHCTPAWAKRAKLHLKNTHTKTTMPFMIAQNQEEYLGVNLTKHVQDLHAETHVVLMKEIRD